MRILVIDDEFVTLSRMTKLLSRWGQCEQAMTGQQAYAMFTNAFEQGIPYDLITFDIEIPDCNGIDLLYKFHNKEKELPLEGWHSKKIVLTANSNIENLMKAKQCQCDAFLVKPIKIKKLEEKMVQIWS